MCSEERYPPYGFYMDEWLFVDEEEVYGYIQSYYADEIIDSEEDIIGIFESYVGEVEDRKHLKRLLVEGYQFYDGGNAYC